MSHQIEIERKFLVTGQGWKTPETAKKIAQGYISNDKENGLVVRVRQKGDKGFLTIKADKGGISRHEFEYEVPLSDCHAMLQDLCGDPIEKTRYRVRVGTHVWDVDEFHGVNEGLILAEVELGSENEAFEKPDWIGPEVSSDVRFFNAYISENPFSGWNISFNDLVKSLS